MFGRKCRLEGGRSTVFARAMCKESMTIAESDLAINDFQMNEVMAEEERREQKIKKERKKIGKFGCED